MRTDAELVSDGYPIPDDELAIADIPAVIRQLSRLAALGEDWQPVTGVHAAMSASGVDAIVARRCAFGLQLRGEVLLTSSIAMDATLFTLPAELTPARAVRFMTPAMASGSNGYAALGWQAEARDTGVVTARQAMHSGARVSFSAQFAMYDD